MALRSAHEGYEYQDLLTCYFIIAELLKEKSAEFKIDRKEYKEDIIDDLTIASNGYSYKTQIKYSNLDSNHILCKSDLSTDAPYHLSIDMLFDGWAKNPNIRNSDLRLCLSWQEPVDSLLQLLKPIQGRNTFENFQTKVYSVDGQKLWPVGSTPDSSWRRLNKAIDSINRSEFITFCDCLLIEVLMPKLSLDLNNPGDLEKLVLAQTKDLGIGVFPNEHWRPETFILSLLAMVKRSRTNGKSLTTSEILHELNVVTDYGSIEQSFPIIQSENIKRLTSIQKFISGITANQKIILVGEPGSGKSWFIENLISHLKKQAINVVRHLCYTDLTDQLQKERIKLNVFYGNLISDVIAAFPHLKKFKHQKLASTLSELNNMLAQVSEPTFLIIDGLDHIDRIATYRKYTDVNKQDIAIIESIGKLKTSPHLKIIITSQNIAKLDIVEGFEQKEIPLWNEGDIQRFLKKNGQNNFTLNGGLRLSRFLMQKSAGNPLYLKYLTDEVKKSKSFDLQILSKLPNYSFNLSEYYNYLTSQLLLGDSVPQILSGVSFSLSQAELSEITHMGDYVSESLLVLAPVLKVNISLSGYAIYHESFRRYIIDILHSKSVSTEKTIFKPISDWFGSKNFFSYRKSFRFYPQFLYEGGDYGKILNLVDYTFVTESVINGQPWELIERNYNLYVKAACNLRDFPAIILSNELAKIIATCKDPFSELYFLYLETMGKIYGFKQVADYLLFEGEPTLPYVDGLKACYVCDENDVVAPWSVYVDQVGKDSPVPESLFHIYVRGLLAIRNEKQLDRLAGRLLKGDLRNHQQKFNAEVSKHNNGQSSNDLRSKFSNIDKILLIKNDAPISEITVDGIRTSANLLLDINSVHTREAEDINKFFADFKSLEVKKPELVNELIDKFKGRNWFYNWLIYYIKIIVIADSANDDYDEVKDAFNYLMFNTEPFEGNPRTCDLYSLQPFIYQTIKQGLYFVKTKGQWKEIIDTLVFVSNKTTTSLQRSISGPLATDKLFLLLSEHTCDENVEHVSSAFEELASDKQEYHLHLDVAEYNLRLASISINTKKQTEANAYFRKAIEFAMAYTMRKDLTLLDVFEAIPEISKVNPTMGFKDLKLARILAESAVHHTDGKETNHFPIIWFESFLKIDSVKAAKYLLGELKDVRYHWWEETSLIDLLCATGGKANPEIEAYLALTFPIADSDKFILYCILLSQQLFTINSELGGKLVGKVVPFMKPMQNRHRSDETERKFTDVLSLYGYPNKISSLPVKPPKTAEYIPWFKLIRDRSDLTSMPDETLLEYIDKNELSECDLHSLSYVIDDCTKSLEIKKEIIRLLVTKNNKRYPDKLNLDPVFNTADEIECYYWTFRFTSDHGDWFQKFNNTDAFIKARSINSPLAYDFFFELLPVHLNISFNMSCSSNLIRLLVAIKHDSHVVERCWENLLQVTSYRLPFHQDISWDELFLNDLNEEEVLLCMLICRLRAGTSERTQWAITSLDYFIDNDADKLVKPFKWFFQNKDKFLKSVHIIILQLIYKGSVKSPGYQLAFEDDLLKDFPSHYFLIDYITGLLFTKPISVLKLPRTLIYPEIEDGDYRYILLLNCRFRAFEFNGIDLNHCFSKYAATFNERFQNSFELYQSKVYRRVVPHILGAEHMLEIINVDCYNELADCARLENPEAFRWESFIDIDAISAQINSFQIRPDDLKKPSDLLQKFTKTNVFEGLEWVRIGHCESELKRNDTFKSTAFKSYGGITYSHPVNNNIPYSRYTLFPFQLWWKNDMNLEIDDEIVFSIIQEDGLENLKILWLNPKLVQLLGLRTVRNKLGLAALDNNDIVILQMRYWICDHLGVGHRSSLHDEIPGLLGTDLIIRHDYFQKLSAFFKNPPTYLEIKIENAAI